MDSTLTELACQLAPQAVAPMGTIGIWQFLKLPAVKEGLNQAVSPFMQLLALSSKAATNQLIPSELVLYGIADQARSLDNKINFMVKNLQPLAVAIPEENRQEPDPRILKQTLNAVDEVFDEPMLKDMFANLLANAMDTRTSSEVHPRFIQIIKGLIPDEADFLFRLKTYQNLFLLQANYKPKDKGWRHAGCSVEDFKDSVHYDPIQVIESLLASGIIESSIPFGKYSLPALAEFQASDLAQEWYQEEEEKALRKMKNEGLTDEEIQFVKGYIQLTPFGKAFIKAVLPKNEITDATQPLETL
ncbi:MAG: DUF4393 domain-containing protein [Vampirovibrionales bacterium]|nr:DUF4393 domain-containing protein [Vampirovibrionales bacterium]